MTDDDGSSERPGRAESDEVGGEAASVPPATNGGEGDDELGAGLPDVPEDPAAAVAADDHALPLEDLQYPTLELEEGAVREDGAVEGAADLDRESMAAWLEDLAGGLASHDVAVEGLDRRVTLGVAPEGVDVSFAPGDDGAGPLEVTFRLRAGTMTVQDTDERPVGARGGRGFVPLAMLTGDRDPTAFRCYNWVDPPGDR